VVHNGLQSLYMMLLWRKTMGIHNYDRGIITAKNRVLKAQMPEKSKELILAMNEDLVLKGLSKPRQMKYLEVLKVVGTKLDKPLDLAEEADLKKIVSEIQQSNFSPWTKQTYKVIIRRFYKWLHQTEDYPAIVRWINIRMNRSETKLPSEGDLLNEEDIKKLLKVAEHPRDKAFVSVLWEFCRGAFLFLIISLLLIKLFVKVYENSVVALLFL